MRRCILAALVVVGETASAGDDAYVVQVATDRGLSTVVENVPVIVEESGGRTWFDTTNEDGSSRTMSVELDAPYLISLLETPLRLEDGTEAETVGQLFEMAGFGGRRDHFPNPDPSISLGHTDLFGVPTAAGVRLSSMFPHRRDPEHSRWEVRPHPSSTYDFGCKVAPLLTAKHVDAYFRYHGLEAPYETPVGTLFRVDDTAYLSSTGLYLDIETTGTGLEYGYTAYSVYVGDGPENGVRIVEGRPHHALRLETRQADSTRTFARIHFVGEFRRGDNLILLTRDVVGEDSFCFPAQPPLPPSRYDDRFLPPDCAPPKPAVSCGDGYEQCTFPLDPIKGDCREKLGYVESCNFFIPMGPAVCSVEGGEQHGHRSLTLTAGMSVSVTIGGGPLPGGIEIGASGSISGTIGVTVVARGRVCMRAWQCFLRKRQLWEWGYVEHGECQIEGTERQCCYILSDQTLTGCAENDPEGEGEDDDDCGFEDDQ